MYTHPFVNGALLQIRRLHRGLLLVGVQLSGRPLLRPTRQRISLRPRLVGQPARNDHDELRTRSVRG